jgi:hypothetical protein
MYTEQIHTPPADPIGMNWFTDNKTQKENQLGAGKRAPLWLVKLTNYEYWPFWLFYLPMVPVWIWQSIRNRSFTWFTATNQNIEYGGFFGESKIDILDQIPEKYRTPSRSVTAGSDFETLHEIRKEMGVGFPLIAKPNVGERGFEVAKIENEDDLIAYHIKAMGDYILQPFLTEPVELGVLFVRFPGEKTGKVTSVTLKEFMEVKGDGVSTLAELMEKEPRFRFQLGSMIEMLGDEIHSVLARGEKRVLEPIGNHCRGTRFVNLNAIINDRLHTVFNEVTHSLDGFYFGRFDLKVASIEDLYRGENIRIMELNGASSEPGHVYDQKTGLLNAYRDLIWHWNALGEIARRNQKRGIKPAPLKEIIALVRGHFAN